MHRAIADRFVDDDVAVADLDIVQAVRIGAYPSFELDGCALAPKVRQRHQIPRTALPASRKREFHAHRPFLSLPHVHLRRRPSATPATAQLWSMDATSTLSARPVSNRTPTER